MCQMAGGENKERLLTFCVKTFHHLKHTASRSFILKLSFRIFSPKFYHYCATLNILYFGVTCLNMWLTAKLAIFMILFESNLKASSRAKIIFNPLNNGLHCRKSICFNFLMVFTDINHSADIPEH